MILVDAHVHLYPCFDRAAFLDAAAENFARAGADAATTARGVLMFAETAADDTFAELARRSGDAIGNWWVHRAEEPESLVARNGTGQMLHLIAGRQIVTADRLEVHALATTERIPDRLPTRETIERVLDAGAIAVLPWGVGKWTGRRGHIVDELLAGPLGKRLFVGDNGGRLRGTSLPKRLCQAIDRDIWMLPGSDPLPLPAQQTRAGACGFALKSVLDDEKSAASLRAALHSLTSQPGTFGEFTAPATFLRNQLAMQFRKHRGRTAPVAADS